jgi:predicted AlkP superfamily phosphohydrolase/phosphomutase
VPRTLRSLPLLAAAALASLLLFADGLRSALPTRAPAPAADATSVPRVVVLGFDGVDERILREYLDAGRLPRLARLRDRGAFAPLLSETPPESPVAWASLLTGVNPGRHGIFDFLAPGRAYRPDNGMVAVTPMRLLADKVVVRPPRARSLLAAPTFLERVRAAGYDVLGLRVPHAFPATPMPGAHVASGLGTPDVAGSSGSYTVWSAVIGFTAGDTTFGGTRVPLPSGKGVARYDTFLPGPFDPSLGRGEHGERQRRALPLRFERVEGDGPPSVRVTLDGSSRVIPAGGRGEFMAATFPLGTWPPIRVRGTVRLEVKGVDPLVVLADPVNVDPRDPPLPMTWPPEYGKELWEKYGPHETMGWQEQTFQLNDRFQDDASFLRDALDDMDRCAAMLMGELARGSRCVFQCFTATDRVSHCFFRFRDVGHPLYDAEAAAKSGDAILQVYARMDAIVGAVEDALGPDDLLLVCSDHGFQTWRWSVNVNQWLVSEGYMTLRQAAGPKSLGDWFRQGESDDPVDWSRTRAYAVGLGQIFVNLEGREDRGIVAAAEVPALVQEIRGKLLALRNPFVPGDEAPVRRVFLLHEAYEGPEASKAAEIQIGFAEGYRVSWQTALLGGMGGPATPVLEQNLVPWSGDHCSTDPEIVPGVLLANRRLAAASTARRLHVRDVAATVLAHFGIDASDLDGRPIDFAR